MLMTLLFSLVPMAALLLMIVAAVAFIQDKRLFTSAPKDIQAAIRPRPQERFRGAHAIGWALLALSAALLVGAFALAGWDGLRRGWGFWALFGRYLAMLWLLKAFDIGVLDWVILCHSHFYQHFYPETEGCAGFSSFGFNRRSHAVQIALSPVLAALLAGVCVLL